MRRTLLIVVTLLAALTLVAQQPAHPEMLVSTDWLAGHLHDKNLVLIQIGPDRAEYEVGHIPGAQFLLNKDVFFAHAAGLPVEKLTSIFRSLGISNDSRVVIYASQYPTVATRLYLMLDYLGMAGNAALLDGGIAKWKNDKRELSQDPVAQPKMGDIIAHPNAYVLAELSDVSSLAGDAVLIDSRPQKRYVDGHIPGAIALYWQQTTAPESMSTFLEADDLAKIYAQAGVKKSTKVIAYCDAGFQATHAYFTLKYLGYDVRMYDGSYNEWNGEKHMPVVTGEKAR